MKTNEEFRIWLVKQSACGLALGWLGKRTPEQAFNECHRGDWLLFWISYAVDQNLEGYPTLLQYKQASIEIAKTVKHHAKDLSIDKVFELLDQYLITENKQLAMEARTLSQEIFQGIHFNNASNAAISAAISAAAVCVSDDIYTSASNSAAYNATTSAAYNGYYAMTANRLQSAEIVRKYCKITF